MATKLIEAKTTNGAGPSVSLVDFDPIQPRFRTVYAFGNWGAAGADVEIEISPDGVNWFLAHSFTGQDDYAIISASFTHIRAVVSDVDGSTSLTAIVV